MAWQHRQRGEDPPPVERDFVYAGPDKIIASVGWADNFDRRGQIYQVLTVRDGKIIDMQDCRSRHDAEQYARRS